MGSFANSLHVRSSDAAAVAEAIRTALLAEGYEPTDEEPDEEAMWGGPSALRAVHVSAARDGWVSVLDSDLMSSMTLTAELSGRLETHTLHFLVNDSDSWLYQFYHDGRKVDAFDSSGDEDEFSEDEDEDGDEAPGMIQADDAARLQQDFIASFQQFQAKMQEMLPPDLREIQERWKTGRATPEEIQKYTTWAQTEMPKLRGGLQELLGGFASVVAARKQQPKLEDEGKFQAHVDHLHPLLKDGIGDDQVCRVLGTKAVFAEETLGDFLLLLGIARYYAYLSYRYLEECTEQDLANNSIQLSEHLRFKRTGGAKRPGLRIVR
jgi:hypothetical protein